MFAFRYMEQIDVVNAAVVDGKLILKQTHETLNGRKEVLAKAEAAYQKFQQATIKKELAGKIQVEADKKERRIEGDLKYTVNSFQDTVDAARNGAKGVELPELKLVSGKVYKTVKMRKADAETISIVYSEGIANIQADQLPQNFVAQYDMGPNSLSAQLQELVKSTTNSDPMQDLNALNNESELQSVRRKISRLLVQIESSTKYKDKLEGEVQEYDNQIKSTETKSTIPTFTLRNMRDVAEGNAGLARNELKALEIEMQKLKSLEAALLIKR